MDSLLEDLNTALHATLEAMSDEALHWHPEGKWCAAEVVEHLYLTYTGTTKAFERVLQAGKPTVTAPSLKQRWQAFFVLTFSYLPEGRKAPKSTMPRGLAVGNVRAEVSAKLAEMDETIGRCEARFGRSRLVDHPVLGPLTGQGWRKFHWIHGRHHLKQIEKLLRSVIGISDPSRDAIRSGN